MGHTLVVRVVFIIFSWEQATGLAEKIALNDPEDGVYGDIGAPGLPPNGEEPVSYTHLTLPTILLV